MTGVMVPLDLVLLIALVGVFMAVAQRQTLEIGCGMLVVIVLVTALFMASIATGRGPVSEGVGMGSTMSGLTSPV